MSEAGCRRQDAGGKMPEAGCRRPDARCQMPVGENHEKPRYGGSVENYRKLFPPFRPPSVGEDEEVGEVEEVEGVEEVDEVKEVEDVEED